MDTHEYFMKMALDEAKKAEAMDEVPVGAVIVKDGIIISKAFNTRETDKDATCHAEMTAIKKACEILGGWRLIGCSMYVTLEPCLMCSGAILQSRIEKLYIGAMDPKTGAAGSVLNAFEDYWFHHKCEVYAGILQEECSNILKEFFRKKRAK
ncbi:tRNA adenosine(34) deaminase TadA [Lutispora thermophila]|uniref:tRNA-specific adenosine deaminase n=1 Tax=Lutispora thermophila DSM 19022 TaxID=1122184 RepID=A0A1M6EH72_9FIRM|nr:tRNA adenosine(34) deaminase TadA [Lutispora thermophila]SHI84783.1 tRNA-adenosine deaminase [Lutispora thermophila DSM 19022]